MTTSFSVISFPRIFVACWITFADLHPDGEPAAGTTCARCRALLTDADPGWRCDGCDRAWLGTGPGSFWRKGRPPIFTRAQLAEKRRLVRDLDPSRPRPALAVLPM